MLLQALGAPQGRWRGEVDLARQFGIADTPFALLDFQDTQVGLVQYYHVNIVSFLRGLVNIY